MILAGRSANVNDFIFPDCLAHYELAGFKELPCVKGRWRYCYIIIIMLIAEKPAF